MGKALSALGVLPNWALQLICIIIAIIATAFTSNVAMCNILMPILINLAIEVKVNPTYICLPAALCLSMAFHLPVSTPPNAIVASYGNISTKDMATGGIIPSTVVIISFFVFIQSWGLLIYPDLNKFPAWAGEGARSE
ncbi:protein I'm not dead yet-like [Eurosta solidaginis]|uniref:protein I'm not dead yet-like n=1 Tax=Eurosta solidaginis TaxID=178769 RepID=UPI00353095A2